MVSEASIAAMAVSLILSAGVPIAAAVWCWLKYKKTFRNTLTGAAIFIVFVLVLERSMHLYFLVTNFEASMILDNPWIYAVYGAFAAGIFEETGRFIGFKFLLRGRERWEDGIAYGIGHGGIEALLIGGAAAAQNLYFSLTMREGSSVLSDTAPYLFLVSGFERMFAMALQVALSLLVLYGVKEKKFRYVIYAVLIHAAVDFPAALYQKGVISNIFAIEGGLLIVAAASMYFIVRSGKAFNSNKKITEGEF